MLLLRTNKLSLRIGHQTICHDLNFHVHAQEIWGILGQNGSGKTTLLHALAALHPITQGEIFLDEKRLQTFSRQTIAQKIGILFQNFNPIFSQTVWEFCLASRFPHLNYFKKESTTDHMIVQQALHAMGLQLLINRKITHLSGGEMKRLTLAALLAQTPDIYLLDEPTNHLDMRHQIHVLNHFKTLAGTNKAAILMSLHDANLAERFCHRILLLFPDGDTMQGTPREVLTTKNLSRLYEHPITSIPNGDQAFWWPKIV